MDSDYNFNRLKIIRSTIFRPTFFNLREHPTHFLKYISLHFFIKFNLDEKKNHKTKNHRKKSFEYFLDHPRIKFLRHSALLSHRLTQHVVRPWQSKNIDERMMIWPHEAHYANIALTYTHRFQSFGVVV